MRDRPSALEGETRIRAALDEGQYLEATTLALKTYGPEILEFVVARHRSEAVGSEVFSLFAEAIWRSAPSFRGESSVRTWAYAVARRTSLRYRRDERRRERRFPPLDAHPELAQLEERIRTETLSFLRTPRREKLAELRASLTEEERELLLLRVDRQLAWNDLALVLAEDSEPLSPDQLKRSAARLRKQFQTLKDRLRAQARKEGLVTGPEDA